jgi:hypothetical protein
MAQHTIVTMTCDLGHRGGSEREATFTHEIIVDGKAFTVDLCEEHEGQFDVAVGKFCVHPISRPVQSVRKRIPLHDRSTIQAARAWGQAQGLAVSDRGRVPNSVLEAFAAAG